MKPEVNDVSVNSRLEFILDSKDILLSSPAAFIIGTGYGTDNCRKSNWNRNEYA